MPSGKAADTEAFVADASVAIAWSVVSQATPGTDRLLDLVQAGTPIAVIVAAQSASFESSTQITELRSSQRKNLRSSGRNPRPQPQMRPAPPMP